MYLSEIPLFTAPLVVNFIFTAALEIALGLETQVLRPSWNQSAFMPVSI